VRGHSAGWSASRRRGIASLDSHPRQGSRFRDDRRFRNPPLGTIHSADLVVDEAGISPASGPRLYRHFMAGAFWVGRSAALIYLMRLLLQQRMKSIALYSAIAGIDWVRKMAA